MSDQDPTRRSASTVGVNQAMTVLSHLIAGIGIWGVLGWLGDRALHTGFLTPLGVVLGATLAIYVVIKRFSVELSSTPPR